VEIQEETVDLGTSAPRAPIALSFDSISTAKAPFSVATTPSTLPVAVPAILLQFLAVLYRQKLRYKNFQVDLPIAVTIPCFTPKYSELTNKKALSYPATVSPSSLGYFCKFTQLLAAASYLWNFC
jgi:hypothetical protein